MARKCNCCKRELVGRTCGYCKYINIEYLDDSEYEVEAHRVNQYKAALLEKVTDFSINAYTYKWNPKTSKLTAGRSKAKIADGSACFDKIAWSKQSFGQNLDDTQQIRPITISYKFDGQEKELTVNLVTIKCPDFWKLGAKINQNLTVSFYLGTLDKHAVTAPYDLELELK